MSDGIYIAVVSVLERFPRVVRNDVLPDLWPLLTRAIEKGQLGFPREVLTDLAWAARFEHVTAWASGLGSLLKPYNGNIRYATPLMDLVANCGFDEGFGSLGGDHEPGAAGVGRLACEYDDEGKPFTIATEDYGEHPLAPTMTQLCERAGWSTIDARGCLRGLGLASLL